MNQFDQQIKDKIAQKQYAYKPQYWKAFKRHSGMSRLASGAKIAISAAVGITVLGIVLLTTLRQNDSANTSNNFQNPLRENAVSSDSCIQTPAIQELNVKDEQDVVSFYKSNKKEIIKSDFQEKDDLGNKADDTFVQPTGKPSQKAVRYGRPLQILVDTIASNDFPEYEAKPADELF